MSIHHSDKHGEYLSLHSFMYVGQCHRGGYYCCQQEVRQYFDGMTRIISGPAIYSQDASPETGAMMRIYSAAKFALECATEAQK